MNELEKKTVDNTFPNTINMTELFDTTDSQIKDLGYSVNLVRPAIALCRDDSDEEVRHQMSDREYPDPFSMETLSGVPVFGKTGMIAWYHHIPDDGLGLIIYGPHIGVDQEGKLGLLNRYGIKKVGKSCGANHVLIALWKNGEFGPYEDDPELSQVATLLKPNKDQILNSENPLLALTEAEYPIGLEKLSRHIQTLHETEEHKYSILLVGGMHIDTRPDINNRFQVRDILLFKNGELKKVPYK